MAKIDKAQAGAVKRLMQSDGWSVIETALANRVSRLKAEEVNGSDSFETLRMLHKKQGKIEGLVEFFEDLEKQAFDD